MKAWMAIPAVLALAACGEGEISEVARYPSPVGGLDAVVGTMKAGEAVPYVVAMTKPGENPGKGTRVLLMDKGPAPKVEWADADHLRVSCEGAPRIWTYRNFWTNGTATVAVGLECGTQGWR
ncbi:MAG TPA: hypothetical protein VK196_17850 [Magnetospirillum sp.]|nr:hypothetical protein [Magnetospirillum sp.]